MIDTCERRKTVILFQYRIFHYRLELLNLMREMLARDGINFEVVYGQAYGKEVLKADQGHLTWGRRVQNIFFPIKEKKDLCWQPVPRDLRNPSMVIFMQENRLLSNYYWIARGWLGQTRTAFWGHGRDFQSKHPDGLREAWKRMLINKVDWWFAYTDITTSHIEKNGFPRERITQVNNSTDVDGFRRNVEAVTQAETHDLRARLGIGAAQPAGLFCGSIYPDKEPDFLIAAIDAIRKAVPDFHFIVIGDGQSAPTIIDAAASRPWLHYVGVQRGKDKAAYYKLASFVLNPGAVGLHVLDAFAAGLPFLTTSTALHGPEIAYLEDRKTGFITSHDTEIFAEAAVSLLLEPGLAAAYRRNCLEAGNNYSVSSAAEKFVDGIKRCLATPKLHQRSSRTPFQTVPD